LKRHAKVHAKGTKRLRPAVERPPQGKRLDPARGRTQAGLAVRERADHAGSSPYLAHDALERVVGSDLDPVAVRGRRSKVRVSAVHIPLTFRKRYGRKLVVTPDGAEWAPRPRVDNAMVKALARAFRWRKMLDEGVHATIEDLARAKDVNATYISRILRLTLLAPDVVEAILNGQQGAELQLDDLLGGFPLEWERQRREMTG
jgi:hypothetical protein